MTNSLEIIVYLVPLIFFALQNIWIALARRELDKGTLVLGLLILPVVTSFYFLTIDISFFVGLLIVSLIFFITSLFADMGDRENWVYFMTTGSGILIILEYYLLVFYF